MKTPQGFRFSGVHAGIKPTRRDLALVVSDVPATAAGCFTQNLAKAAPVLDAEQRLPADAIRAVVVNSGNANALTGPVGIEDCRRVCAAVASALEVPAGEVLAASTGVIGVRLPAEKLIAAAPTLVGALCAVPQAAAEAIMTTDTRIKMAARVLTLGGKSVTVSAICKGSGMIAPQLATMIAVVFTDCAITKGMLDAALRGAMGPSFNCLTVDGDMSTNDAVFALANGLAGNAVIADPGADFDAFAASLGSLCEELAKEIAADGEGATKQLEVTVSGAPTVDIARDIAKAIAGSALVKAAMFGADPNWGRVLSTVGARAGSQGFAVDPQQASVTIQGMCVFTGGAPVELDATALKHRMRAPQVGISVALAEGQHTGTAWGCDLSYDYVKINADYTSLIVQTPDGGVAKDDRLTNYSPAFKRSLLVEALSYISRFSNKRCVVKYGGAAMLKASLKKSFCDDIKLLKSVGLQPIVVHGGGPEISRTLEQLGGAKPEFIDGVRVTSASDLKVVEMVLTGQVNAELVTLLNQDGAHAMGVSGKDGALLRARKLHADHGRDLGQVGEITAVNKSVLEMLLGQGFVPVISPVGLGEDGQSYNINADAAAAQIAIAVGANKLIYLTDVAGILREGELVSELCAADLEAELAAGTIAGGMKAKTQSILEALRGGVSRVHVIDGRTPHSVIAELFTDRGVGSLITLEAP